MRRDRKTAIDGLNSLGSSYAPEQECLTRGTLFGLGLRAAFLLEEIEDTRVSRPSCDIPDYRSMIASITIPSRNMLMLMRFHTTALIADRAAHRAPESRRSAYTEYARIGTTAAL